MFVCHLLFLLPIIESQDVIFKLVRKMLVSWSRLTLDNRESRCCLRVGEEDALIVALFQLSIIESYDVISE